MPLKSRTSCLVAIGCFALLLALAAMAVQRARIEALKMSSSNTLRQIGLGLMNYESAFKRLPMGCDRGEKHGWMTNIAMYMEASPWYSSIYKDEAWDHPTNAHKFWIPMYYWERPGVSELITEEGFGLTHYLANPCVLHRDSKVRLSEMKAGLANTWIAGEVSGKYQPYGYPLNWRPLMWPLNGGHGGYGGWSDGAQLCMGDNAIRFVSSRIDQSVVERLAESMPMPDARDVEISDREFKSTSQLKPRKRLSFVNNDGEGSFRSKRVTESEIVFDAHERPEVAVLKSPRDRSIKPGITIETILEKYPDVKVLDYGKVLDDGGAEIIAKFHNIEALVAGRLLLTESGIQSLTSLPRLKSIFCIAGDEETADKLKAALPNCVIHFRKR